MRWIFYLIVALERPSALEGFLLLKFGYPAIAAWLVIQDLQDLGLPKGPRIKLTRWTPKLQQHWLSCPHPCNFLIPQDVECSKMNDGIQFTLFLRMGDEVEKQSTTIIKPLVCHSFSLWYPCFPFQRERGIALLVDYTREWSLGIFSDRKCFSSDGN